MPIKIPDSLPAKPILQSENIFIMPEQIALHQDIRPVRIVILNLMPTKITTETQLLRLLSNSPLQTEIDLMQTKTYTSKNTPAQHLISFYKTFDELCHKRYDGMIITGAPIEHLKFEDVDYWDELCNIFEWANTNVYSTMHICWGAQAGLYYRYGIEKYDLPKKMFGVFPHKSLYPHHQLLKGFDETYMVPHSRHTGISACDIEKEPRLNILSHSDEAGIYIVSDTNNRLFYVTGHSEYDVDTLAAEYFRDAKKGLSIDIPKNYFPNDDSNEPPVITWRAHANLLYTNWLNYFVYQGTPYNLEELI